MVAPERDLKTDVDALIAAVTPRTKVVFLANPNNPTGTYLPIQEVRRLHAALPPTVLLVLDAAYAEYVRRNDYESGIELVSAFRERGVMTRTFSKVYGLAALRIGWLYGPEHVVDALNRTRGPFNLSAPAIAAGAAAIRDRAFIDAPSPTTSAGSAGSRGDRQARPDRHAVGRQLPADPFSRGGRAHRRRTADDFPHRRRHRAPPRRRLRPAERAAHERRRRGGNRATVAALAAFLGRGR